MSTALQEWRTAGSTHRLRGSERVATARTERPDVVIAAPTGGEVR
jgi:hypothetical protein